MRNRLCRISLPLLLLTFSTALEASANTTTITFGVIKYEYRPSFPLGYSDPFNGSELFDGANINNRFLLKGDGLLVWGGVTGFLLAGWSVDPGGRFAVSGFNTDSTFPRPPFMINGVTYNRWNFSDDYLSLGFLSPGVVLPSDVTQPSVTVSYPFTLSGHISGGNNQLNVSRNDSDLVGQGVATATFVRVIGAINTVWLLRTVTLRIGTDTTTNPIEQPDFFIYEQYIDFLNRPPDVAGLQGWQNILNNCGKTVAAPCDRIEVSADFFRSPEFQERGYFIYKFYSTLGRIPHFVEFKTDFNNIGFNSETPLPPDQVEAHKVAYADNFVRRPEFQNKYGSLTDPTAYVDALLQTVGLPNHPSRATWINGLTNGTLTRAQVLRALTESAEVSSKYYNEAFVIMEYFGYLHRDADASYLQWIKTMNDNGGDYRVMVNGFLNSPEYRQRFAP